MPGGPRSGVYNLKGSKISVPSVLIPPPTRTDCVTLNIERAAPMTISEPGQAPEFAILYRRAFEEFGSAALWSSKPVLDPTPADALAITRSLRVEGNLQARRLAEQIERACRAAV